MTSTIIYVCQASTCRSRGSEGVLVEIEELSKLVDGKTVTKCEVKPSDCLGLCNVGPAAVVVGKRKDLLKRRINLSIEEDKIVEHVGIKTIEKSAAVVKQATSVKPNLDLLPSQVQTKLAKIRQSRARQYAIKTFKWNKAAALSVEPNELQEILNKVGYKPGIIIPSKIEKYVLWTIRNMKVVSNHSLILELSTKDKQRGTPHPRGRSKIATPVTWHTTILGRFGLTDNEGQRRPFPWIERDYTPISTAKEWEQGICRILIKIYSDGQLTSWLKNYLLDEQQQQQPKQLWLSQPIPTLSVPTLTAANDNPDYSSSPSVFKPKSILLLLGGTGCVTIPQLLAHQDPIRKLGIATPKSKQLRNCPIDVIVSFRQDDILLVEQLKEEWCNYKNKSTNQWPTSTTKGIRNLTVLITPSKNKTDGGDEPSPFLCNNDHVTASPYQKASAEMNKSDLEEYFHQQEEDEASTAERNRMGNNKSSNNIRVLYSRINEDIINSALLDMIEISPYYRVTISGPESFNSITRKYLLKANVDPNHITVLSA